MQLSVIILNYNVRYFLELCVLSVQSALEHIEGEIIVVDNNRKMIVAKWWSSVFQM
jgi:glycosyltransferase involved in cell wall biosynthesis